MAAVVFYHEGVKRIAGNAVIDAVRKATHHVASHASFKHGPPLGSILDRGDRRIEHAQESLAKTRNSLCVELHRFEQFYFGVRVIDQPHSRTRRAVSIT